ncbi:MAG: NAD+ synthase [Candidatus Marinimicrobia bacterium]|nr:NAD+ synthase [Candidatus Neomarinimicrobiota bacterium]
MKVALCQINTIVGNLNYNKEKILKYYKKSIEKGSNIAIFPELVITGYPPQDLLCEKLFVEESIKILKEISRISTIPIILGYVRAEEKKIYNSAALCYDGKIRYIYDKILLPTYDVFDEERYFTSGRIPSIIEIPHNKKKIKIGLQICEDLWDDNYICKVTEKQFKLGAEYFINISASPFHSNQFQDRKSLIERKIKKFKKPFFYCNTVGAQDELIFDGQSMAFSNKGDLVAFAKPFEEDLLMVDIDSKKEVNIKLHSKEEATYNALCLGVKDYFKKTGHCQAVLGLSGGIDSALVATIATDALGPKSVHGISLPSKYSSKHSLNDAEELAIRLDIDYRVIPIQTVVNEIELALKPHFNNTKRNIAEENIQARIRGNILMAISNKFGWMLLSTGNKTELALGYCTLYGDMSGGLSVISDLSKSEVYSLSNWINKAYPTRIPQNTINKPPSAELSPNQVDPFDYDIVSPLVDDIVEKGKSIGELEETDIDKDLLHSVFNKIRGNEFKRRQAAPGLRVSEKAFGIGRRYPLVNHFNGRAIDNE